MGFQGFLIRVPVKGHAHRSAPDGKCTKGAASPLLFRGGFFELQRYRIRPGFARLRRRLSWVRWNPARRCLIKEGMSVVWSGKKAFRPAAGRLLNPRFDFSTVPLLCEDRLRTRKRGF